MSQIFDFSGTHTYLITDLMNLAMRARHHAHGESAEEAVGMTMHIVLNSIKAAFKKFDATHLVVAAEGRSFRKDLYPKYKANRAEVKEQQSLEDKHEMELLFAALDELQELIADSKATMLRCPITEADDMIARWIQTHPDDQHVLVSSDSDFVQLVRPNVLLHDPLRRINITPDGAFDEKGKALKFSITSSGKIKVEKEFLGKNDTLDNPDEFWEFAKFIKCVKGDSSDNIFTAYPGVRMKGSKNKVGLLEAFKDRKTQGFAWVNFMNQSWEDPEGNTHVVKEGYEINRQLIDLGLQPDDIKILMDREIQAAKERQGKDVAFRFMRFVGKHQLQDIGQKATDYLMFLQKGL